MGLLSDYLERKKREELLTRAQALAELKDVAAATADKPDTLTDVQGLAVNLPTRPRFDAGQQVDLSLVLQDLGLDEKKMAETREAEVRTGKFLSALEQLRDPAQQLDAVNKRDVAPVAQAGGVAYNRYDTTGNPILDESSAVEALAAERTQQGKLYGTQAREAEARLGAIEEALRAPDPLVRADVANKKTVSTPQRVKVRRKDGTEVYMNATRSADGGYSYTPAVDAQNEPLRVPPSASADGRTALQKDTAFIAETLDIRPEDAILFKLQSRQKSSPALWQDLVGRITSSQKYADATEIQGRAAEIWAIMRPGEPIPNAPAPADPLDPATPAAAGAPRGDEQADARRRAQAEGYTNLGQWVAGRGFEVFDAQGRLIGHYH